MDAKRFVPTQRSELQFARKSLLHANMI